MLDAELPTRIKSLLGLQRLSAIEAILLLNKAIKIMHSLVRGYQEELSKNVVIKPHQPSPKTVQARKVNKIAAEAADSIMKSTKILGRAIGDIYYSELYAMRRESRFAASLADQIIKCGTPADPNNTKIRQMVNPDELATMIKKAKAAAAMAEIVKPAKKARPSRKASATSERRPSA